MINTLNAALQEVIADPEIIKTWAEEGFVALPEGATHGRRGKRA